MKDEYIIINKTAIQKRIEELGKITLKTSNEDNRGFTQEVWNDLIDDSTLSSEYKTLKQILSQSTPLIPEIEKAFTKGERYGWDSQKSIGNIDEMKERIKLQSLDNYISNLKLDI